MNILPLADCTPQPWKNGGGISYPMLVWPSEADWRVRISVAHIDQDGPFSSYQDVHRWFAVLEGEGVALHLSAGVLRLTPQSPPLHFDGAEAPGCTLLGGATRDFNFMLRRAESGGLIRVGRTPWLSPRAHRAVFTLGAATLHTPGADWVLPEMTLAWTDGAADAPWRLTHTGRAWWLDWKNT